MASRLLPDIPAVLVALEHIKELDKELKDEGVAFSPDASFHLAELTAAITSLEAERRAAHEHLEVATIENSTLRHLVNNTRDQMSEVIMADVAAARASNAEEIEQLHKELLSVSQLQEATVKTHEALVSQNETLFIERENMKETHQGVIAALNNEITQKYALQLKLDQTKEKIEELQSLTHTCKLNALILQQNLALEKETFCDCRYKLSYELNETEKSVRSTEQEIVTGRKEVQSLHESRRDAGDHLDELRIKNFQVESSIQKLKASKSQCKENLEAERETQQELKAQKEVLEKELEELLKTYNITTTGLKEDITAIENKMVGARASRVRIQDALEKVYEVFIVHDNEESDVRAEYEYVSAQLQKSRMQLEERIASIVRHRKEMNEMDRQIEELKDRDMVNKRMFERDQDELGVNMDTERLNIKALEDEKKQLKKLLEESRRKQEEHVKKMTEQIKATWRRYKELQKEEAELKKLQPMSKDVIKSHMVELQAKNKQIESAIQEEIQQYSRETEDVMKTCEEKQKEVAEKKEVLQEVEAKWKEEASRHKNMKSLEAEFKMKKHNLGQSVDRLKVHTTILLEPKQDRKAELERIRASHMQQLGKQASELKSVEMRIYDSKVKLEQVQVENSRLQLRIKQMTEDMTKTREDKSRYTEETEKLKRDIQIIFESLQEAWRDELLLTEDRDSVDGALMIPMNALQSHLKTRGQQMSHVQTVLHELMLDFSRRLGDQITVDPQLERKM